MTANADTTSCVAPLAHNDLGNVRVVLSTKKVQLKSTNVPTIVAMRDLWHVMQEAGFTETKFYATDDGYGFLEILRPQPDGGVVPVES